MGFLLYVVIWLWAVLHTEVMTTQSAGVSPRVYNFKDQYTLPITSKANSNHLLSDSKDL